MRTWLLAALALVAVTAAQGQDPEHGFAPSQAAAHMTELQQQLTARGYYAGAVDGRMTPALRTAVSVYQSDVGMRVTGIPDLAVVNMLKFGPDVKATIQPLGQKQPVAARTAGVPPYEPPALYRHPEAPVEAAEEAAPCPKPRRSEAKKAEEPPLPKAAPQHRVVSSPLPAG